MDTWVVASSTAEGIVLGWSGKIVSDSNHDMVGGISEGSVVEPDANVEDGELPTNIELLFLGEW